MLTRDRKLPDHRLPESRKGRSRGPANGWQNKKEDRSCRRAFDDTGTLRSAGLYPQAGIEKIGEASVDKITRNRDGMSRWMKDQAIANFILQQRLITIIYSH